MSRSGYTGDFDDPLDFGRYFGRWRGVVASAIRGKRGQAFLRDLLAALDAMPVKRLIAHDLIREGEVCAIGSLGLARGIDMSAIDPEDYVAVASEFGIAAPLVQEIEFINDETMLYRPTPERRWEIVRAWVVEQIKGGKQP